MTRLLLSAFLLLALLTACAEHQEEGPIPVTREGRPYLHAATEIAKWLENAAVQTPHGRAWPDDVEKPATITPWLSTGVAGTTLFFLRLHEVTRDPAYLEPARGGADYLRALIPARLPAEDLDTLHPASGLYSGWAGVGFVLGEAYRVSGEEKYRRGAMRCVQLLHDAARDENDGVAWNSRTDILDGSAGTSLFLLYAADRLDHGPSLELAEAAGRTVLSRAIEDTASGGLTWTMSAENESILPNFSHGAAGIGYFLATLHWQTRNDRFLEAALQAGAYLKSIARTDDDAVLLVPYGWPRPEWEGLYDIGWAHGPAGTARLIHRLARITGDPEWSAIHSLCGEGIRLSGLPGSPNPGFGDEPFKPDLRFGQAGVASFFLRLYEETGEARDLEYAQSLLDDLLARGTADSRGLRWTRPRYAFMEDAGMDATHNGYFYGASGLGLVLIQMDGVLTGLGYEFGLPDDPYGADMGF